MNIELQISQDKVNRYYNQKLGELDALYDEAVETHQQLHSELSELLNERSIYTKLRRKPTREVSALQSRVNRARLEMSRLEHEKMKTRMMKRHFFEKEQDAARALARYGELRKEIHDFNLNIYDSENKSAVVS